MLLTDLIAAVLDADPAFLGEESGRGALEVWDSLAHLNIIAAVEETYGVLFSSSEMRGLTSVGSIREALATRNVAA